MSRQRRGGKLPGDRRWDLLRQAGGQTRGIRAAKSAEESPGFGRGRSQWRRGFHQSRRVSLTLLRGEWVAPQSVSACRKDPFNSVRHRFQAVLASVPDFSSGLPAGRPRPTAAPRAGKEKTPRMALDFQARTRLLSRFLGGESAATTSGGGPTSFRDKCSAAPGPLDEGRAFLFA